MNNENISKFGPMNVIPITWRELAAVCGSPVKGVLYEVRIFERGLGEASAILGIKYLCYFERFLRLLKMQKKKTFHVGVTPPLHVLPLCFKRY